MRIVFTRKTSKLTILSEIYSRKKIKYIFLHVNKMRFKNISNRGTQNLLDYIWMFILCIEITLQTGIFIFTIVFYSTFLTCAVSCWQSVYSEYFYSFAWRTNEQFVYSFCISFTIHNRITLLGMYYILFHGNNLQFLALCI